MVIKKKVRTNDRLRSLDGVGDEGGDEAGFSDSGITDQYDLEGVIVAATALN
jgi:hypothetical protein